MIGSTIIDFLWKNHNSDHENLIGKRSADINTANLSILGSSSTETFADNVSILARSIGLGEIVLPDFSIRLKFYLLESPSTPSNQCHTQLTFIEKKQSR